MSGAGNALLRADGPHTAGRWVPVADYPATRRRNAFHRVLVIDYSTRGAGEGRGIVVEVVAMWAHDEKRFVSYFDPETDSGLAPLKHSGAIWYLEAAYPPGVVPGRAFAGITS